MFFGSKDSDGRDWADQAADHIEGFIDGLHDKAVVPLTTVARAIVYGLLAAIVGIAALIIFAIVFVRILNIYLGNAIHLASVVWLADYIVGAIFVVSGLFLWAKRYPKAQ